MHPVLFRIGNFTLGTYGLLIVAGLLAGVWLAARLARRRGLPPEFFYDLAFCVLLSGFIGARILFILLDWRNFLADPLPMIFSRQGFVFLGGFAMAVAAAIVFARRRRVPLLEMGDIAAPALVLAHAFGRVGCFLAGCCYGRACPADAPHGWLDRLAVQYPLVADPGGAPSMMFNFAYWGQQHEGLIGPHAAAPLPILPVQLFEALGNLAICFVLLALWRRRKFSGQIFALYLMLYGALRFALEILRGDSERGLWLGGAISTSQIICIGLLAAGAVMWGVLRGRGIPPLPPPAEPAPAAATVKAGRPAKPRGRKPR